MYVQKQCASCTYCTVVTKLSLQFDATYKSHDTPLKITENYFVGSKLKRLKCVDGSYSQKMYDVSLMLKQAHH